MTKLREFEDSWALDFMELESIGVHAWAFGKYFYKKNISRLHWCKTVQMIKKC